MNLNLGFTPLVSGPLDQLPASLGYSLPPAEGNYNSLRLAFAAVLGGALKLAPKYLRAYVGLQDCF